MRKEMTYDNFEALCDRLSHAPFQCGNWWPSVEDVKTKLEPKLEQNLEFLVWISETASEPVTPEQEESKKYINKLLIDNLVLVNTKEELKQLIKQGSVKSNKIKTEDDIDSEEDIEEGEE